MPKKLKSKRVNRIPIQGEVKLPAPYYKVNPPGPYEVLIITATTVSKFTTNNHHWLNVEVQCSAVDEDGSAVAPLEFAINEINANNVNDWFNVYDDWVTISNKDEMIYKILETMRNKFTSERLLKLCLEGSTLARNLWNILYN